MIIFLFFLGFILGLAYSLIGEKLPLLVPEVEEKEENSWILNLFIGIVHGVFILCSYYSYGISYEFFISLIIAALVIIIFISDFKYMIILDSPLIIAGIFVLGLKFYYFDLKTMLFSLLYGFILFLFMYFIGFIGSKIFKKEALGGGDIKLSFIIGLILDWKLGLIVIILSSLISMPYALASLMLNKANEVPYGPFLVGSLAIVFIFSDKFMNIISLIG
jgi:prepilin signal peptidase PulO-like enzyme (type II secretory pathway)